MNPRTVLAAFGLLILTGALVAFDRQPRPGALPAGGDAAALASPFVSPLASPFASPLAATSAATPAAGPLAGATGPAVGQRGMATPAARQPAGGATPTADPAAADDTAAGLPAATAAATREYLVQPGDTLLGVAAAHGVSMASLQMANDLGAAPVLYAGQRLVIPPPRPGESLYWTAYTLAPGDSILALADRFGVSAEKIIAVNDLDPGDTLYVGQVLIIPADTLVVAAAPPATPLPPTPLPPTPLATAGPATPAASPTVAEPAGSPTAIPILPPPTGGNPEWAAELTALINEARAANGLPPYTYNSLLALAAQGHAEDCSRRGYCSHVGSDGADLRTRLARVGYGPPLNAWGENWAWDRTPDGTFHRWFDEPPGADPHRRNILNVRYTEIGIGIAPASSTAWYFIADFGDR